MTKLSRNDSEGYKRGEKGIDGAHPKHLKQIGLGKRASSRPTQFDEDGNYKHGDNYVVVSK